MTYPGTDVVARVLLVGVTDQMVPIPGGIFVVLDGHQSESVVVVTRMFHDHHHRRLAVDQDEDEIPIGIMGSPWSVHSAPLLDAGYYLLLF